MIVACLIVLMVIPYFPRISLLLPCPLRFPAGLAAFPAAAISLPFEPF